MMFDLQTQKFEKSWEKMKIKMCLLFSIIKSECYNLESLNGFINGSQRNEHRLLLTGFQHTSYPVKKENKQTHI